MKLFELLQWQHQGYPRYHGHRSNLLLHIVVVPLFWAGNVGLAVGLVQGRLWLWLAGIAAMALSLGLQGRGHRLEPLPAEPFSSPGQAVARLLFEQWITFPRFVISGRWWRALRQART